MESIGDILTRLAIRRNTPGGATAISSNRDAVPPCPRCDGAGFLRRDVQVDDPRFGELIPCVCKEREVQERRLRTLVERSNLAAMADMTFESFIGDARGSAAFRRAQHFADHPEGWLVIMGGYGTGKTHLAAAIGNHRLAHAQQVLFQVVPDLLDHLRSAYAPDSETSYDSMFEGLRQAPLLILDDLGTQISSLWAKEKLFQLFNYRYIQKLPTVVTTNNSLDEIGGRLASRMSDPNLSVCVTLDGNDFRGGAREEDAPRAGRGGYGGGSGSRPQRRTQRPGVEFTDRL